MRNLEFAIAKGVYTKIDEIMYQSGNIRDPLTGRLCRGTEFIDEEVRAEEKIQREKNTSTEPY